MSLLSLRAPSRGVLRFWGFVIAVASVILPALPLGPLFAQPPFPLAVLWAAYGWAAENQNDWRAPITLALLGLVHDQMAGGPFGLFIALYLSAYLIGRVASVMMSVPTWPSLWAGFGVTAALTIAIAWVIAPLALGPDVSVRPYAEAVAITVLLFPIVQGLYMDSGPASRVHPGLRR